MNGEMLEHTEIKTKVLTLLIILSTLLNTLSLSRKFSLDKGFTYPLEKKQSQISLSKTKCACLSILKQNGILKIIIFIE